VEGSGTSEGTQGRTLSEERRLYLNISARVSDFLFTPLLMGPVCYLARAGMKSQSAPE